MTPQPVTFAQRFSALMESRGLSQRQTAILLNVSDSQVSRWRTGRGGITLESIERIAKAFGQEREELARLAGLLGTSAASTESAADQEIKALLDSERAETHEELRGIDPRFWPTIIEAGRVAKQAAAKIAKMAAPPSNSGKDGQPKSANDEADGKFNNGGISRAGTPQAGGYLVAAAG